jgi:glutamate-1-semialdehyde 2,1-aminomutase
MPSGGPASAGGRQALMRQDAEDLFPGGVNSAVEAFRAVGRPPLILDAGKGARVRDADGNWYLDYIGGWGPAILGHGVPAVIDAIRAAARDGFALGATSPLEIELGKRIRVAMPSMERLRFTSSGAEAVRGAIRLARGATGRDLVVTFAGGDHGHGGGTLVEAGPTPRDAGPGFAIPAVSGLAGVTTAAARDTVAIPYNDPATLAQVFEIHGNRVAAVIVEPVAVNVGVIAPAPGYLEWLRDLTASNGALLIFDEVTTGFRVARGGAQARFGVTPDLTALGGVIGGGLPAGAWGGRADLMRHLAPEGPVQQDGTQAGNPVAMAAGIATLDLLTPYVYDQLELSGARLEASLAAAAAEAGRTVAIARVGSLLTVFFRSGVPRDGAEAMASDQDAYARFFGSMLDHGVLLPPSGLRAWSISVDHADTDITTTVVAARRAFAA